MKLCARILSDRHLVDEPFGFLNQNTLPNDNETCFLEIGIQTLESGSCVIDKHSQTELNASDTIWCSHVYHDNLSEQKGTRHKLAQTIFTGDAYIMEDELNSM